MRAASRSRPENRLVSSSHVQSKMLAPGRTHVQGARKACRLRGTQPLLTQTGIIPNGVES